MNATSVPAESSASGESERAVPPSGPGPFHPLEVPQSWTTCPLAFTNDTSSPAASIASGDPARAVPPSGAGPFHPAEVPQSWTI